MPSLTVEELRDLGVEVDANPEPPRAPFEEAPLPGKPASDVKLVLVDGTALRERIVQVPLLEEDSRVGGGVATAGFNLVISNALLDDAGRVVRGPSGDVLRAPVHEVPFTGERLGAMAEAEVEEALRHAREVAAARARQFFAGMERGHRLFAGRLAGNR